MHIQAVMETLPYFVLAGCIDYARYIPVYITEMKQLEEQEPLMYRHLIEGGFVVRRSFQKKVNALLLCVDRDLQLRAD